METKIGLKNQVVREIRDKIRVTFGSSYWEVEKSRV